MLLALVRKGVAREEAYRWVQRNGMKAMEGADFRAEVGARSGHRASHLDAAELAELFDLRHHLRYEETSLRTRLWRGGMEKRELLYEGKAKRVYTTDNPDLVIQYFKDDATAFNAKKRGTIVSKGIINNEISETFFRLLEREGVPTHFVERLNDREMLVKRLDIIPVETVVRNIIAGSLAKRLGLEEGKSLPAPIVEYYYKSDALDDPMINAVARDRLRHGHARRSCRRSTTWR